MQTTHERQSFYGSGPGTGARPWLLSSLTGLQGLVSQQSFCHVSLKVLVCQSLSDDTPDDRTPLSVFVTG